MKNVDSELDNILLDLKGLEGYSNETAIANIKKVFDYEDIKPLIDRKREFKANLLPFVEKYGELMIASFFCYWIETKGKRMDRRMRWEKETTWNIAGRLALWATRQKKFSIAGIIAKRNNS